MERKLFLIILYSSICISCNTTPKSNNTKINSFVGKWIYTVEDETLTLDLELMKDNEIIGEYCNIAYSGNRIDCAPNNKKNINGILKNDTLFLKFKGFYDEGARGEAKLYKENDSCIVWILGKSEGDFYLPEEARLKRSTLEQDDRKDCKVVPIRTEEKEVDYKLIEKFETYYQKAPFYTTSNEYTEEEEIEMMKISLDMCDFFHIKATELYLWKLQPKNKIKVCLLYATFPPYSDLSIFHTLSEDNKIIDKLSISGASEKNDIISEYAVDYINGDNIIYIDKTDGQRVFDKKKYHITSAGKFELIK